MKKHLLCLAFVICSTLTSASAAPVLFTLSQGTAVSDQFSVGAVVNDWSDLASDGQHHISFYLSGVTVDPFGGGASALTNGADPGAPTLFGLTSSGQIQFSGPALVFWQGPAFSTGSSISFQSDDFPYINVGDFGTYNSYSNLLTLTISSAAPEPASLLLASGCLAGIAFWQRRRLSR